MNPQAIIDEFFIKDGEITPKGRIKRSILLAIFEDFKFSILLPGKWRCVQLSADQKEILRDIIPSFTVALLFCSAVDLLARVVNKRETEVKKKENAIFFKKCAETWFHLNSEESNQLWFLRNSISHKYSLAPRQILNQYGHGRLIRQNGIYWEFYLHAMFGALRKSISEIYDHLSNESLEEKLKTADYLASHGFIYTSRGQS